jgi:membrane protein required for colicin V production
MINLKLKERWGLLTQKLSIDFRDGFIKGLFKGFISEVASVIGLLSGIFLASKFNDDLSYYLQTFIEWDENYLLFLSFFILLVLTILIFSIAGKLITKLAKLIALGVFNKLLGGVFGVLKNVLVLSVLFFMFNMLNSSLELVDENKLESSIYYNPLNEFSIRISTYALQENN